ncbi:MAG TPA: hypothetical protein VEO54_06035 [Thermoanaerobaculia bacterium]|nr:hypothetical protein [Thermoanaerobaculia bacterium]
MSYTDWLRRQVSRLEEEIRACSLFDTDSPATPAELKALRSKVVIHTYLRQQLLRREVLAAPPVTAEEYDTQEFVMVRRA